MSGSPGLAGSLPSPRCWKLAQLKQAVLMWLHPHVKNTFTTKYSLHHFGDVRVYLLGTFLGNKKVDSFMKIMYTWSRMCKSKFCTLSFVLGCWP